MSIYIIVFIILVIFCCFENNKKLFYMAIFALFIIAALRGEDVDRDYKTYLSIYDYLVNGYQYTIEPTFILLCLVSKSLINSPFLIFPVYAALGLYFKSKFIKEYSPYLFLSLVVYYSNFFFIHELTQIRIGVASAIGFYSIKYLIRDNKKTFVLMVLFSCLFHFSMVVFLVALFFDKNKIDIRFVISIFFMLFLSYILIGLKLSPLDILQYVPISVIHEKLVMYKYQTQHGMIEPVNVFSVMQFLRIGIVAFVFFHARKFSNNSAMVLLTKIYSLSPICLVLLSSLPAFAIRLSELFAVADIVLLPIIVTYCTQKKIANVVVIALSATALFINLYHNEIVNGYYI